MHNTSQLLWLDTALGKYLLASEKAIYDVHVANVFGFNALQMGMLAHDLLEQSRIPQKLHVDVDVGDVRLEPAFLPFSDASIDLICLPHTLEFSQNPHQTLREVERVLLPEGYVVLTGFNPYSLWGVRRVLSKRKLYPWCGTHLTMSRVQDWLALLGLETVKCGTLGFALPVNDSRWLGKQRFLESMGHRCMPFFGGIYYILAQKRVVNMTLLKPNWKKSLVPAGLMTKPQQSKPIKQTSNKINNN
jgi:SAM-dependent methyltransferase